MQEVLRRDWMFKLVGEDTFCIDQSRCIIRVDPAPGFKYEYSLRIDGKPYDQYTEELTRQYRLWLYARQPAETSDTSQEYRIMLKLDTLSLYVNDELREEAVSVRGLQTYLLCSNVAATSILPYRLCSCMVAQTPVSWYRIHSLCYRHVPVATNTTASCTHCSPMGNLFQRQRYSK